MRKQAMVRGPAAQPPPEARHDIALRAITRQPFHPQRRLGRAPVLPQGPPMPGRILNREDDRGTLPGRRGPGDIPQGGRTRSVPALLCAQTRLGGAARGLLQQARRPLPLVLILGMMNTREPAAFLEPFVKQKPRVLTLTIPGEANAHKASYIAEEARKLGLEAKPFRGLETAVDTAASFGKARVVIGGSLYLGGHVLDKNGTPPN